MDIINLYKEIKERIEDRFKTFNGIKSRNDNKELFIELVFCILTPQSRARSAEKCMENLLTDDKLFKYSSENIKPIINKVRFNDRKSNYIVLARNDFIEKSKYNLSNLLNNNDIFQLREWIYNNVKGIGLKEASHFLRNVGRGDKIAILDRHILKNLIKFKVIDTIPKNLDKKNYYEIENKMNDFADKISIPLSHLDFIWWYSETKDIFK